MTDVRPRPSRRLLLRGVLYGTVGLGLMLASSFAMPDDVAARNDGLVWPTIIGIFSGLAGMVVGAGMFVVGVVKRLREPRTVRPPGTKLPTKGQAVAIIGGAVILGLSSCGVFAISLEGDGAVALLLVLGGAVVFLASGLALLYGLIMLVQRLRGR